MKGRCAKPALWLAVVLLALGAWSLLAPGEAFALGARTALEPTTAEAEAKSLLRSGNYTFCTKPPHPLSGRARELCPLAAEIPGCSELVLACDEHEPPPSEFWTAFAARFARWFGAVGMYVGWALLVTIALGVVYLIVRAVAAARGETVEVGLDLPAADVELLAGPPVPETATAAELLLRRAAAARERGDGKTALVTYLAAALRALDDRGAIRLARDRTNGEYVRSCQELSARPKLRDVVRQVDAVQFGGSDATPDAVSAVALAAESIVREPSGGLPRALSGVVMALGLMVLLGACQGGAGGGSRDDPAGRDLLADLLEKEGAHVSSLPGSLSHLPLEGTSGPVVILDAERVPLEEETRTHLVAWVKQGGRLVLAGPPALWPAEFWAKGTETSCTGGLTTLKVETRDPLPGEDDEDEDDDEPRKVTKLPLPPKRVQHAKVASPAAMTWPNEDRAPRAVVRLENGDLYGALHAFGDGQILGLAGADLLSNAALGVPGNASALIALLGTLGRTEFAIARAEQGVAAPENPFAGLIHVGLGPALLHLVFFVPLLFVAFGRRQTAPRATPSAQRRAFAEHVQAVGALYARKRAARHALAVYAKYVDSRVRAVMPRGADPAQFLAGRAGVDASWMADVYAKSQRAESQDKPEGDELQVLQRLSSAYAKAMGPK